MIVRSSICAQLSAHFDVLYHGAKIQKAVVNEVGRCWLKVASLQCVTRAVRYKKQERCILQNNKCFLQCYSNYVVKD